MKYISDWIASAWWSGLNKIPVVAAIDTEKHKKAMISSTDREKLTSTNNT